MNNRLQSARLLAFVASRLQEFSIRKALGANRAAVCLGLMKFSLAVIAHITGNAYVDPPLHARRSRFLPSNARRCRT